MTSRVVSYTCPQCQRTGEKDLPEKPLGKYHIWKMLCQCQNLYTICVNPDTLETMGVKTAYWPQMQAEHTQRLTQWLWRDYGKEDDE